jgi:phage FluMu gp28-like protein
MPEPLNLAHLEAARDDIAVFAERLLGEPLWPHQVALASDPARIVSVCSGRQAGKSRALAVKALHTALRTPNSNVLIVSAGEDAARGLLDMCGSLAQVPVLSESVADETTMRLSLSNGSVIRSVPASQKQVRGKSVDLLLIDEGCFVEEDVLQAAKFTMLARPGAQLVMASTPYGLQDRFFAVSYRAGQRGVDGYSSHHWPSTVSPLVDEALLAMFRETSTDREFRAEVLAEWVDDSGAYFPSAVIESAVEDYDLIPPGEADGMGAVAGVDWGKRRDASACVLVSAHPDRADTFYLPWLLERFRTQYSVFCDELVTVAKGYRLQEIISELSGVGDGPTEMLEERLVKAKVKTKVRGIHTDNRGKENNFGALLLMLEQGRLVIPRHPGLIKQLMSCEFETTPAGNVTIAVPERAGHDDLLMALSFAVPAVRSDIDRRRKRALLRSLDLGEMNAALWKPSSWRMGEPSGSSPPPRPGPEIDRWYGGGS